MAERLSLETYFDSIPAECRHLLDHKLEKDENARLATIAKSITDWQVVANYFPGIDDQDIAAIKHDSPMSLDLQKISLLKKWRVKNGYQVTYRQLATSLFDAGANESVHTLCQELRALPNPPACPTPSQSIHDISHQPGPAPGGSYSHVEAPSPEPQAISSSTQPSQVTEMTASSTPSSMPPSDCSTTQDGSVRVRALEIIEKAAQLKDMFVAVVMHTKRCLMKKEEESEAFLTEFQSMLEELPLSNKHKHLHFLEKEKDRINSAKNVREISDILRPYWNYRDYAFLETILKEFGTSELQEEMKEYIAELEKFEKTTSVKDYNSAALDEIQIPAHFKNRAFTLLKDPAQCSLYEVRQLKNEIVNRSTLTGYSVFLESTTCNSVKIVLAFPPEAYTELSEVLDEQFMATHQLQWTKEETKKQTLPDESKSTGQIRPSEVYKDLSAVFNDGQFSKTHRLLEATLSAVPQPSLGPQPKPEKEPMSSSTLVSEVTASNKAASISSKPAVGPDVAFEMHIQERVAQLRGQFKSVVKHTKSCFVKRRGESKNFFSNFKSTLINLRNAQRNPHGYFLQREERDCINGAEDVKEIWRILKCYWNYVDYGFLELNVNEFCTSELQQEMKEYIEELERFESVTTIQSSFHIPSLQHRNVPNHFSRLVITMAQSAMDTTLYYVRKFKNEIADQLNINRYAVYLVRIACGSIVIELAIPPSISEGLISKGCRDDHDRDINIPSSSVCRDDRVFVPQLVVVQ